MKLFHYHHWTDRVEETENFYVRQGFSVKGRFGKEKTYHPPLGWDDFRRENPQLRIIEMRKGEVNVTFGQGKKPMFDHIGYLVSKQEHDEICSRARKLGWNVNSNNRRTFVGTPFRLRIELQQREAIVGGKNDTIQSMDISVKTTSGIEKLPKLFGEPLRELHFNQGEQIELNRVVIKGIENRTVTDPQGVHLVFEPSNF